MMKVNMSFRRSSSTPTYKCTMAVMALLFSPSGSRMGAPGGAGGPERSGRKRRRRPDAVVGVGTAAESRVKRRLTEEKAAAAAAMEREEGMTRDPLAVLGADILSRILELSDACSVARCTAVSRGWHEIAASDYLWASMFEELVIGKSHIPQLSKLRGASRLASYSMSIMDGKRTRIMKEDLCDHVWEFRFKKAAPEYWRNLDPSWKGTGPLMHRYFHPSGSHTARPDDPVWGGHECTYSIMTSYVGDGQIRDHYVRINRWPPMTVLRENDWSWEMHNHLYYYKSIPDADKEGGTGPLFPAW